MSRGRLFDNSRARRRDDFRRAVATRIDTPRILIVTEGEKTEPNYLRELIARERLSSAKIVVSGECGSDPMGVFRHARDLYKKEEKQGGKFDEVYCVFDRDRHTNFHSAIDAIRRALPRGVFHATYSVPCFEYWILLHFKYSARPYNAPEGSSACEQLMKDFPTELSKYKKGFSGLYGKLIDRTEIAIERAKQRTAEADVSGSENPITWVHILIEDLYRLRK